MANVSALWTSGMYVGASIGVITGVVSGIYYLITTGIKWAGELKLQISQWLGRIFPKLFSKFRDVKTEDGNIMSGDTVNTVSVREFIEILVEVMVAEEMDNVSVGRLSTHPLYNSMFNMFHSELSHNLARLSFSLQMALANKDDVESELPFTPHAELKALLQKVIQEAMRLPNIKVLENDHEGNDTVDDVSTSEDLKSKVYEEVLATAIINKIIQKYAGHNSCMDKNKNVVKNGKVRDCCCGLQKSEALHSMCCCPDKESCDYLLSRHVDFHDCQLKKCLHYQQNSENETGSISYSPIKFEKLENVQFPEFEVSFVQDFEELCSSSDSEDEGSSRHVDFISNTINSWEENWSFMKKQLKTPVTSQPVPMLVPNPSEDVKALVGDCDPEDMSDLSECNEDHLVSLVSLEETSNDYPADSHIVISHKIQDFSCDSGHTSSFNHSKTSSNKETDDEPELVNTESPEISGEFEQKDSEYTEDYATVQTFAVVEAEVPVPKPRLIDSKNQEIEIKPNKINGFETDVVYEDFVTNENSLNTPPREGTIAKREHDKWEKAKPIPNNPYSEENIKRRLSKQNTSFDLPCSADSSLNILVEMKDDAEASQIYSGENLDHTRYERDFYINDSKLKLNKSTNELENELLSDPDFSMEVSAQFLLSDLQKHVLHCDVLHSSFNSRKTTPQFAVNPWFEEEQKLNSFSETDGDKLLENSINEERKSEDINCSKPCNLFFGNEISDCLYEEKENDLANSFLLMTQTQANQFKNNIDPLEINDKDKISNLKTNPLYKNDSILDVDLFSVNESSEEEKDVLLAESGYYSSDSGKDENSNALRLMPPTDQQVVQVSFESLSMLRQSSFHNKYYIKRSLHDCDGKSRIKCKKI